MSKTRRQLFKSDYRRIRGEKNFRLPPGEREPGLIDPNKRDNPVADDGNPGRTRRAPNPDDL